MKEEVSYKVEKTEKHPFENIYTLLLSKNNKKISIEIPTMIFEDLGISAEKIDTVKLVVFKQKPDLEPWDLVLRAIVYKIKMTDTKEKTVYASAGGLQIRIFGEESETFSEDEYIYLALKFARSSRGVGLALLA